jgi:Xylose isomerase-like TIM barrel
VALTLRLIAGLTPAEVAAAFLVSEPREPRVKMSFDSVARTLLGIEKIGLPNVGILLDFGHSLYGGESPADAAQLAIDYGRLFGMDVNDNLRGWDDDLVAGTVHPIELFEFFYTLRKNAWEGVWQLDQFPFREDSVSAARAAIEFLKAVDRGLNDGLDRLVVPSTGFPRWAVRPSVPSGTHCFHQRASLSAPALALREPRNSAGSTRLARGWRRRVP